MLETARDLRIRRYLPSNISTMSSASQYFSLRFAIFRILGKVNNQSTTIHLPYLNIVGLFSSRLFKERSFSINCTLSGPLTLSYMGDFTDQKEKSEVVNLNFVVFFLHPEEFSGLGYL